MAKQTQSSSSFWRYLNISYYLKRPHLLAIVSFLFIFATFVIWDHRTLVNEYEEEISRLYEENKELLKQLEERKSVFDGGKESNSKTLNNDHVNHEQDARFHMEDVDPITRERRNKVKEAMSHAWKSYVKYAWGYDELLPQSQRGANDLGGLGATIVDSLDTLYIMGFHDEFQKAKEWISNSLDFNKDYDASVFETTIRVLGGLLSAFDLSSEKIFLEKAKDLGERLLVAWNSPTGIPYGAINLASGRASNPGWTGGSSILADLGTEQIEFIALSQRTGELKYMQKVENVISQLKKVFPADGLLPIYISPGTGNPTNSKVTFGAMGDSFYEYLLKVWIQGNKTQTVQNYRDMWEQSMEGLMTLIKKSTPSSFVYIAERSGPNYLQDKMDELACFAPGMLALGSDGATPEKAEKYLNLAKELAWTCYNFYQRTPTKLAGENYYFRNGEDMVVGTSWNILRPETVESLMYLWRKTGDNVYREWGWDIFQAFEKQSRTESGYVGLRDVNSGAKDDKMQTFFLAETLKYLYLLFSPSSVIPLDEWVFNTEAHPIRIRTRNGEGLDLEGEIKIGETNNVKVLRNSLDSQSQRERHANINQVRDQLQKRNFRNMHIGKRDIGFNR